MSIEMEIDEVTKENFISNVPSSSSISLHPLVILNISEHWTRLSAQGNKSNPTIGALIGKHNGRIVEIINSFELLFTVQDDGKLLIDRDYYNTKEEQFKQVFCDLEFIGWYETGTDSDQPTLQDILVHKQINDIVGNPIFLKMDNQSGHTSLPIKVYESINDKSYVDSKITFIEVTYTLSNEDVERIGIDHVARLSSSESHENSYVADNLTVQFNAIKMLHSRVKMFLEYLKETRNSGIFTNHEILRELASLKQRLPVMESEEFYTDLFTHCNDVALIAYLGVLTKCTNQLNVFCNKFNLLFDRQIFDTKHYM